ncbi:DUF2207 family protein [Peptoniphilus indolicus]|uniref:Predicted membrane protein YciQ-like C-terminal domain-containing protein n=2 Tax=Peptoniphilus indolicus TaxID=33030 RepID=G4D651_9FIRM|nr:DUF2207 domain-containing protein [Peptoniphilus indolicus]EGY77432.1 hypothetical protein HMPREF9129_1881 [Peptoniphilus indolicus ATCC 29427]SUB74518.1 Uncharacterised protein [Peptoniphilus indolicus]
MNNLIEHLNPINANIISIMLIISISILLKKSFKNNIRKEVEMPKINLTPAQISSLVFGNMKFIKSLTATLLCLNENKNINLNIGTKDFSIDFLTDENLEKPEKYLIQFFKTINPKNITSKDILRERKSAPDDFNKSMQKYFDLVEQSLYTKNLKKKNNIKIPALIILIALMYLIVALILTYYKGFLALIVIPLSLILSFNQTKKIFEKTPQGEKLHVEYLKFVENFENKKINTSSLTTKDIINLIALDAKSEHIESILKLNNIDSSKYTTLFETNNFIFADKKSR